LLRLTWREPDEFEPNWRAPERMEEAMSILDLWLSPVRNLKWVSARFGPR
jgi:hypothetical protein